MAQQFEQITMTGFGIARICGPCCPCSISATSAAFGGFSTRRWLMLGAGSPLCCPIGPCFIDAAAPIAPDFRLIPVNSAPTVWGRILVGADDDYQRGHFIASCDVDAVAPMFV